MIKPVTFQYTKSDVDVSMRAGFMLSKPSKNYTVLEILESEADFDTAEELLKAEFARHEEAVKQICKEYNLGFKYFSEDKVSNLEVLDNGS